MIFCLAALAQDEAPAPEKPEKEENQKKELATEAREEARLSLLRHIEARKLIRRLSDPQKRAAALEKLDKLGTEAIIEMLASKKKEAREALGELCEGWVRQLSSEDFKQRDRAFRLLYAAGEAGLEPLKKASASGGAHLSQKTKLLLHMIDYRISPELYKRLGHVMADFKKAGWRKKIDMIAELERLGGTLAIPALKKIITRETNPRVQAQAANSLIRVGTIKDLLFLKKIGLAEKIQAPAITAEIYLSQGLKYMEAKQYEEAIGEFKKALKDSPDDFRTHYEIAMAYLLSEKYALSITHYKKCLKQQPNNYLVHYNLACAYSLMNDVDNAVKHLALSIENGYKDLSHMEKDEDLDNIRSDTRYKELKDKLQRESEPKDDKPPEKDK
jgi:tetratricopeptide (TPR) repeat protein